MFEWAQLELGGGCGPQACRWPHYCARLFVANHLDEHKQQKRQSERRQQLRPAPAPPVSRACQEATRQHSMATHDRLSNHNNNGQANSRVRRQQQHHHDSPHITLRNAAALISACCLLLTLAVGPSQCAPIGLSATTTTTTTTSNAIPVHSAQRLQQVRQAAAKPARQPHATQPLKQTTTATTTTTHSATGSKAQLGESSRRLVSAPPSAVPLASSTGAFQLEPERLFDNQAARSDEKEIVLLVLTSEQSAGSLRRLIKRSGISDQRLAEIQMMRALRKQLEREAAASKSTGQSDKPAPADNGGGEAAAAAAAASR